MRKEQVAMVNIKLFKKYFDEEDWEEVTLEQVEERLTEFYINVAPVLDDLLNGHTVYTDVAEYRKIADA